MLNPKARPCDEAAIRSTAAAGGCSENAKPWVLAVTIMASTISYIDESVVNVALPTIEADLKASAAVVQWLVNAYMLSLTALVLIGGAAGDQLGRRRVFVAGTGLFAVASLWCGLSPDIGQLIVARIIQGAGAALLIPVRSRSSGRLSTKANAARQSAPGRRSRQSPRRPARFSVAGSWITSRGAGSSSSIRSLRCRRS